jgi:putative membrane protein
MDINYIGIAVGAVTFLVIGLFHPLVIKAEYYWGKRSWTAFLIAGLAFLALSLCSANEYVSIVAGVVSFSSFWSILEIFEQVERVKKGWFPMNPKRKDEYR